jgi:hypothetical protein
MARRPDPSVDLRDYRIRITGVSSADTKRVLARHKQLADSGRVKARHFKQSTIVHFYATCKPEFVDRVAADLMTTLCPTINNGLLEEFEARQSRQLEELKATA